MPRVFVTSSPNLQSVATVPSIKRRLIAMLYEAVILFGVLFIFCYPYFALTRQSYPLPTPQRWFFQVYVFLVLGLYFVWMWRKGGQTLPMRTWRIQVQNADGSAISTTCAIFRYILAYPSVFLGIGLVWAWFDKDKQFLHDRLAGTRLTKL